MKQIKNTFKTLLIILLIVSCTEEDRDLDFVNTVPPPSNVSVTFDVTQDNTGLVTLSPKADGANSFEIDLGDGSALVTLAAGERTD